MAEPYVFEIESESDFDGTTPMDLTLDDFERVDGRHFKIKIAGPAGLIPPNFFGLMTATSPKLVGVAGRTWNPQSVARVVSGSVVDEFRQELDLTPRIQHVGLFAGDRLALRTMNDGRSNIFISVNEMSESDHVQFALQEGQRHQWRRFRIIRDTGSGFVANFNASLWTPGFQWIDSSNLLQVSDNTEGPIPIRALCLYPRFVGCFLSVRFANVDTKGRLYVVDPITRSHRQVDVVDNMAWSKVQFASHDDLIVLESHGPASGSKVIADLELTRARPIDRMRGRYTREA